MFESAKLNHIGSVRYLLSTPVVRSGCGVLFFLFLRTLFTGCATDTSYQPSLTAVPAKSASYPIPVYTENMRIPRPCKLIGQVSVGNSSFSMMGGSIKDVMETLMDMAHKKGADVVQVISIKRPDFSNTSYGIKVNLLQYADKWETIPISEKAFLTYLRKHRRTLDPIEGIWSNDYSERIGIIRNTSKPGRNFVAFTLNTTLPSWHEGYKKIDIAYGKQPGSYDLKYYRDDFSVAKTNVMLDHNYAFSFIINTSNGAYEVRFTKINPAPSSN
jgi:hypothetical protein